MSISSVMRATSPRWSFDSPAKRAMPSRCFTSIPVHSFPGWLIDPLSDAVAGQPRRPDLHPRLATADGELADVCERRRLAGEHEARGLGDEHRVARALRQALHARGRVERVADDRVLEPV